MASRENTKECSHNEKTTLRNMTWCKLCGLTIGDLENENEKEL
tara:strand:+ start:1454 stop:1582 length:129 start_codon:yes stop_codon:yes gene_type:complete